MSLTAAYADLVNRTYRNSPAIGVNAIVPRVVLSLIDAGVARHRSILDYGAGTDAPHAHRLHDLGYHVTAYDIGSNVGSGLHDPDALARDYDIVYASNVLNVQPDRVYIDLVVREIASVVSPGGVAVANYPSSPRKAGLSVSEVDAVLRDWFAQVDRVPGESTPVWLLRVPMSRRRSVTCTCRARGAGSRPRVTASVVGGSTTRSRGGRR